MPLVPNPIERLHEQRAQRLLELLQDDLRAQMRQEDDDAGRRGRHKPPRSAQQRLQMKIARLSEPSTREQVWNRVTVPQFQGTAINELPKSRSFWETVDVTTWTKNQLDVACELLDLAPGGRKADLVARLQDWVHAPALAAAKAESERLERERERSLATGRVFAWGRNAHGELGLGDRRPRRTPTEIESFRGVEVAAVASGFDANFAFAVAADGRVFAWGGGGKSLVDIASGSGAGPKAVVVSANRKPFPAHHRPASVDTPVSPSVVNDKAPVDAADAPGCFLLPRVVPQLHRRRVASIVCARSDGHMALTTADGACLSWGRGDHGELGIGAGDASADVLAKVLLPVPVTAFNVMGAVRITQVSVGNCHSAAVTSDGDLFTWGACWSGQLGLGVAKRNGVRLAREQVFFPTPTPVEAFAKTRVAKVSCGAVHTAVISANGQLFTFGCSDGGRLGHGAAAPYVESVDVLHPELVKALEKELVLDVVCCSWHSLCLVRSRSDRFPEREGFVFAFGHGMHGQLGLGKQKMAAIPTRIPEFVHRKLRCRKIAASSLHSCALSADGKLFTWGHNSSGCLGRELPSGSTDATEPDVVSAFTGFGVGPIVSIACGHQFTVVATGPWEPFEPATTIELNERLNHHARNPIPTHRKHSTAE